jgi:hypothetical protein
MYKPKSESSKILDQNGNYAWTREKYLQTWKNHYERLLATEEKTIETNLPTTSEENVNMDMRDVEIAIGQMKKKSPGDDAVTVEMITNADPLGMQWLYRLLRKIWTENVTRRLAQRNQYQYIKKEIGSCAVTTEE